VENELHDQPELMLVHQTEAIPVFDTAGFMADNFLNPWAVSAFQRDLAHSMMNVGRGHDPYNHVGRDIVSERIGVSLARSPNRQV